MSDDEMVIVSAKRKREYFHRSEDCYYVAKMANTERVSLSAVADLNACSLCGSGDPQIVDVCPECEGTNFQHVVGGTPSSVDTDHDYRCNESGCLARFDEPATRRRRGSSECRRGIAGKLMNADPDDVSAENAGEPMTDGGEDVVYYASGMYKVYHRDRDCRYLQLADSITEQPVSTLNGTRDPCGVCAQDGAEETGRLVTDGGVVRWD